MTTCAPFSFEMFAEAVVQADEPSQVAEALATMSHRFGFRAITICEFLPLACDDPPHDVLAECWPDDWPVNDVRRWLETYQKHRWLDYLPWSLTLHASRKVEQLSTQDRSKGGHARSEDLIFVPVPQSDGRLGMVTFIGRRNDPTAFFTTLFEACATVAYRRCRMLLDRSKTNILTRQQRTICSWLALGKTSAEIGDILGITEATVDQHVRQCKDRLGTANRTATVIEAIRRGQLLSVSCNSR